MNATPENNLNKQANGQFQKGISGNPQGKPKGATNHATRATLELLQGESEALTRKAVEMALGGDLGALKLCLDKLLPKCKELPLPALDIPLGLRQDFLHGILDSVLKGKMTIDEATRLRELKKSM